MASGNDRPITLSDLKALLKAQSDETKAQLDAMKEPNQNQNLSFAKNVMIAIMKNTLENKKNICFILLHVQQ